MALEKQCSQFLMRGLGITAYDSESDAEVAYEDIVTSEYYSDSETYAHQFGKLGTVFSIRAYGYRAYVESTSNDPLAEAHAVKFDGASRICIYPKDTHYPLQIVAYTGRSSSGSEIKPVFFPGYYLTEDSVSPNVSGMTSIAPTLPDRWYITATYGNSFGEDQLTFWASTTPDFSDVTKNYWPIAITTVTRKQYLSSSNPDADWILQYIEPIEYDGTEDSVDNSTSIDPKYMLMGWLVGRRIAGQRYKHPELPDGVLISSDGYILTDCNGVYLTASMSADTDVPDDKPVAYLYGTPSESGNIGLRVGDTVTYYAGAVLSKLPEMAYQYAAIVPNAYAPYDGYAYNLWNLSAPLYISNATDNGNASGRTRVYTEKGASYKGWKGNPDGKAWDFTFENSSSTGSVTTEMPIWTNEDIYAEIDGNRSLYIAASDPIPVGEIVDYNGEIPIYEVRKHELD